MIFCGKICLAFLFVVIYAAAVFDIIVTMHYEKQVIYRDFYS